MGVLGGWVFSCGRDNPAGVSTFQVPLQARNPCRREGVGRHAQHTPACDGLPTLNVQPRGPNLECGAAWRAATHSRTYTFAPTHSCAAIHSRLGAQAPPGPRASSCCSGGGLSFKYTHSHSRALSHTHTCSLSHTHIHTLSLSTHTRSRALSLSLPPCLSRTNTHKHARSAEGGAPLDAGVGGVRIRERPPARARVAVALHVAHAQRPRAPHRLGQLRPIYIHKWTLNRHKWTMSRRRWTIHGRRTRAAPAPPAPPRPTVPRGRTLL